MDENDITLECVQAAAARCKYFNGTHRLRNRAINHIKSGLPVTEYPVDRRPQRNVMTTEQSIAAKLAVFPFYFHDEWNREEISRRDIIYGGKNTRDK